MPLSARSCSKYNHLSSSICTSTLRTLYPDSVLKCINHVEFMLLPLPLVPFSLSFQVAHQLDAPECVLACER